MFHVEHFFFSKKIDCDIYQSRICLCLRTGKVEPLSWADTMADLEAQGLLPAIWDWACIPSLTDGSMDIPWPE
jgi:hypothetical protein